MLMFARTFTMGLNVKSAAHTRVLSGISKEVKEINILYDFDENELGKIA